MPTLNISQPTAKVTAGASPTVTAPATTLKLNLNAPYEVVDATRYVSANGSDANSGKSWRTAYATIGQAVTDLGATGGTIHVGAGTFEAFTIDGSSTTKTGLRIVGQGPQLSKVVASSATANAITLYSQDSSTSVQQITIQGLFLQGGATSGHGLQLGGKTGEEWNQYGGIHVEDCWIADSGGDGVYAFCLNSCVFINVRVRDNGGWGWHFTGNSADGSGSVLRGNTNTFVNCYTNGNTSGGWFFDKCGNSWNIIGGEQNAHDAAGVYAIKVVPATNFRNLNLYGVHFERNTRAVLLGDGNATGTFACATFTGCFFDLQTDSYDVVLNGATNVVFNACQFGGGYTGVLCQGTGSYTDWVEMIGCKAGSSSGVLLEDKFGSTVTTTDRYVSVPQPTTAHTIRDGNHVIIVPSGSPTTTLPTAVGRLGRQFTVKNMGAGTVTVATTSSQTIDGQTTQTLNQYDSITVCSDGANWAII